MTGSWRDSYLEPEDIKTLLKALHCLQRQFHQSTLSSVALPLAFRGMADEQHHLEPSLQYTLKIETHDADGLDDEQSLITEFRTRAMRFLGPLEREYLAAMRPGDASDARTWSALAIARHYGVPTRLLDWTLNVSVAAYFAACKHPEKDGAVWWFSQADFEEAVNARWDAWEVPVRDENGERAIEKKAFTVDATPWVSKVHQALPFARMEKQAGFFTACGQLGLRHNDAIDALNGGGIRRGRVIIRGRLKEQLLDHLESIGFKASTIDYPGADIVGAELTHRRRR
jgi:hypothetical protein